MVKYLRYDVCLYVIIGLFLASVLGLPLALNLGMTLVWVLGVALLGCALSSSPYLMVKDGEITLAEFEIITKQALDIDEEEEDDNVLEISEGAYNFMTNNGQGMHYLDYVMIAYLVASGWFVTTIFFALMVLFVKTVQNENSWWRKRLRDNLRGRF